MRKDVTKYRRKTDERPQPAVASRAVDARRASAQLVRRPPVADVPRTRDRSHTHSRNGGGDVDTTT